MIEHYTITGAADWAAIVFFGSLSWFVLNGILASLIAIIYRALPKRQDLMDLRREVHLDIERFASRIEASLEKLVIREEGARNKETDAIWTEIRQGRKACQADTHKRIGDLWMALGDCQRDCCPRGRMKDEPGR